MENIECIDPRLGEEVSALMEMSVEESVKCFSAEPASLKEPRLHWYSCPSCRAAYPGAEEIIKSVRQGIEQWAMKALSEICDKYLIEDDSSQPINTDARELYASRLASLMVHGEQLHESDIQWALCYAVEGLPDFTVRCDQPDESSQRVPLSRCADYISSLEPKAQAIVFASVLCHEMYYQLYRKAVRKTQEILIRDNPETGDFIRTANDEYEHPYDTDFIRESIKNEILCDAVPPEIAFDSLWAAASEYLRRFKQGVHGSPHNGQNQLQNLPGGGVHSSIALDELRSDVSDSFDSLKAGQNELLRLIERNSRPASAFEPDIEMQLGNLYGRLESKTKRLLQIAEYLYDINKSEPNFFHGPLLMLAYAYENELSVRIIGRYSLGLLEAGTKTYFCDEGTTTPLIYGGEPQNLSLGEMKRYLKRDNRLREWVKHRGLSSVDAIAKDAATLVGIRNRAAHEPILERSVADEIRRLLLRSDGMLSRLFPSKTEA